MINSWRGFVEEHRIRGYEAGPDQHTTMPSIANIVQEVASNHAVAMWGRSEEGFATDPMLADKGLIFVMTRLQIQMDAYPKWGQVMMVETWFQASGKIGAQRDFLFRCKETGKVLGRATSTWVMINLHTRKLQKMPDEVREKCFWYAEEAPARQAIAPVYTKQKIPEVALPAEIVGPAQVARRSDVDMNGHINNVTYLCWCLETVPPEVYKACHLYQVEIDFKAECHCGDLVESLAQRSVPPEALASNGAGPQSLAFVHTLRRCDGDKCTELVRMRTIWRAGEAP